MLINDATKIAQYDTGAEGNFMSKTLAKKYKLLVQRSRNQQGSFAIANGKRIKSSGQAEAWCTFALDPGRKMKCVFQIWDKLAGGDLIMGRAFLSETRTLSSFRHRLRERISSLSLPTINFIGSTTTDSCCRFACNIDGRPTHINADTGSDLDVISLRYARAQRYEINTEERKLVRLGDASVVGTYGQVEAEVDVGGYKYWKVFDVLPDLTSDVVLGELTLEEVEAYTRFETSFTDINLGKRNFEMNIMITIGKIGNLIRPRRQLNSTATYPTPLEQQDEADLQENTRRDREEKRIKAMRDDDPAKAAALRAEDERKTEYERQKRSNQHYCELAVPVGGTSSTERSTTERV